MHFGVAWSNCKVKFQIRIENRKFFMKWTTRPVVTWALFDMGQKEGQIPLRPYACRYACTYGCMYGCSCLTGGTDENRRYDSSVSETPSASLIFSSSPLKQTSIIITSTENVSALRPPRRMNCCFRRTGFSHWSYFHSAIFTHFQSPRFPVQWL